MCKIIKYQTDITAGAGWCFPWKNPLRDTFCNFSHGNTKSVSERKIRETHYVFLSGFP